jgi:nitrogen regulatory protein PII 2
MKQIIAIIRNERVEETKTVLEKTGILGMTFLYVTGRGRQNGSANAQELGEVLNRNFRMQLTRAERARGPSESGKELSAGALPTEKESGSGFLPKRMLVIIAHDADVEPIVQAIIDANQTGRYGDGRIFICPMITAIRVRNREQGDKALC